MEIEQTINLLPSWNFEEIDNLILKFTWKNNFENEEIFGRPALPNFTHSNKTTAVKTRNRSMQQMESLQIDLHISAQLILKAPSQFSEEREVFLMNSTR